MLKIHIPKGEAYNSEKNEFYQTEACDIVLEHSLVSISKWESKWHKPFLSNKKDDKTQEQVIDYIRCMTITQNVNPNAYYCIPSSVSKEISDYIQDSHTATTFYNARNNQTQNGSRPNEVITSELIYFWMVNYNIPSDYEKWNLNRLLTLIKICNIKNNTGNKKMPKKEITSRNAALNAARRASLGTNG